MNKRGCHRALLVAACLSLAGCATAGAVGELPAVLNGMVYGDDNQPVADAAVSIDGKTFGGTDLNGRFAASGLPFGRHVIVICKEGYEGASLPVDFGNPLMVVYARLHSAAQLLAEAESEVEAREWGKALSLLDRVDALKPGFREAAYLRAVVRFRSGNPEAALAILEPLAAEGPPDPWIELFMADILEFSLGKPEEARPHLTRYLAIRYDPDAAKRLEATRPPQ